MVTRLALVAVLTVCACATGCAEDRTEAEVDWSLASPPVGREVDVRAEFGGSSCSEFKDWDVAETSSSVTIRATVEYFGNECTRTWWSSRCPSCSMNPPVIVACSGAVPSQRSLLDRTVRLSTTAGRRPADHPRTPAQ